LLTGGTPAITAYHRLIQLSPQNANAYYNLGIALQRQKQNRKSPPSGAPLTFTSSKTRQGVQSRSRAQGIAAVISRVDVLLVPQNIFQVGRAYHHAGFIGLLVEVGVRLFQVGERDIPSDRPLASLPTFTVSRA